MEKIDFTSNRIVYTCLGETIRKFAEENHIRYREVTYHTRMSNTTYRSVLSGKDMHLNCYLRLFNYFSTYFRDPHLFFIFLLDFLKKGLREISRIAGMDTESWWEEENTQNILNKKKIYQTKK